jgi:predicted permease
MHWLTRFFQKEKSEQQLDAELRFHLEKQISDYIYSGLTPEEARRRANLEFGGLESIKQQSRESRRANLLETLMQDLRYALRTLRKSPGFTSIAILTLALGIGTNTALFSLVNALVLRDLPVPHPEELVRFGVHLPDDPYSALSLPMFEQISRSQTVFSETFAWWGGGTLNVEMGGSLTRADVWAVDGNFFSELGAIPKIGRVFGSEEVDSSSAVPAQLAVLSYGFWQRHYGASPEVIGKTVKIEALPFKIIGVTSEHFSGVSADDPPELMVPLNSEPLLVGDENIKKHLSRPDALWIEAAGRLKQGTTLEQARAQLNSLWPAIQKTLQPANLTPLEATFFQSLRMQVESGATGSSFLRERFSKALYIVLAIAGALLLLACANLAGLLLARSTSRSHEMAVRVALGASRARLMCQMITESLVLSLGGTAAGFVLAEWGSQLLASFILQQTYTHPARLDLSLDAHVLGFTAAAAILTGVLIGLAPALQATREDPNAALQHSARTLAGGSGRLGRSLIVTQVALSLILVAGAGLFLRSLKNLHSAEPGFRTRGLIAAGLFPRPGARKDLARVSYFRELLDRISQLPAVESVGMVRMTPGNSFEWTEHVRSTGTNSGGSSIDLVMLMPQSFAPLGIRLLQGRHFTWQDDDHARQVAIVSKNLAEKLFPGCNPIGQHLDVTIESKWQSLEIVGLVNNASYYDLRKQAPMTLYVPTSQYGDYMEYNDLLIQTQASPAALGYAIRRVVDASGHDYVFSLKSVGQLIDKTFLRERVTAMLSAFFGALALVLAAIGLYGQMAYSVTRRTREIGIRIALGARQRAVQQMVLREAFTLVGLGVLIGVPCSLVTSGLITTMLFGLSPRDPATLGMVIAVLLAASALAALLPARRAMRVDPLVALRQE